MLSRVLSGCSDNDLALPHCHLFILLVWKHLCDKRAAQPQTVVFLRRKMGGVHPAPASSQLLEPARQEKEALG